MLVLKGRQTMRRPLALFKTRDAAEVAAVMASHPDKAAFSNVRSRELYASNWIDRCYGKVYVSKHSKRCKDGKFRDFYSYELGA